MSTNTITISNQITLKSQKCVKWLRIYIDRKLTFKKHVNKKIANATRVLHSISRLQNIEESLSSMISRQLYMTCINAISDYESEIWWKNQKQFRDKLQKLQNIALRKILEVFRTSLIAAMKIKANIKSVNIRLDQKNQKLRLRMMKMKKNHSIRLKISNFSLENWNETLKDQSAGFSEWYQTDSHATQLIRIMHSMSKFITDDHLIEKKASIKNIWKKSRLNLEINQDSNARETHLKKIEKISQTSSSAVFYTNAAHDSKSKISTAWCVFYHNTQAAYKTWNLRIEMSIDNAKLYAIEKATNWSKTLNNIDQIWIFTDSQNAIKCIENSTHFLAEKIYETIKKLTNIQIHIQWISEHANISENEKADQLAKSILSSSIIANDRFLSFKYLNNQIIEYNHQRWSQSWTNNTKKSKHYEKFDIKSEDSKIQLLSKKFIKHVISTIMQLKLEHDYFKSYLIRLSNYDRKKCNENCHFVQNPEHLLLNCRHFIIERSKFINNMKSQNFTLKTLFETKKDIENLKIFLINIEIVTRKWILRNVKKNNEDENE